MLAKTDTSSFLSSPPALQLQGKQEAPGSWWQLSCRSARPALAPTKAMTGLSLIWVTAVGPTPEEKWHNPFLTSSSWTLLPSCLQDKPTPQVPQTTEPFPRLSCPKPAQEAPEKQWLLNAAQENIPPCAYTQHLRSGATLLHVHSEAEHGFTEQEA